MSRHYLVTGGAGFIGSNYAARLLGRGERVTIYDNLSRTGAPINVEWLRGRFGEASFRLTVADVRDAEALMSAASGADVIIHLASQVAVTASVVDPRTDFEVNALGTFNVLEAARRSGRRPVVVYASTNKVYGQMGGVAVVADDTRYRYADPGFAVAETQPVDFHSPYGCSKGAADQYVRDYHRIYSLPTVVMRQSCIYGTRQFGTEEQGWVMWFVIAAVTGRPITIYGDGRQLRDLLYVDDLLDAYDAALDHVEAAAGQVYNVGGGRENAISIWREFGEMLEKRLGNRMAVSWGDWRPGDQLVYVSDTSKAQRELKWRPRIGLAEGLDRLCAWVREHRDLFA